jgi:hypothetical protein
MKLGFVCAAIRWKMTELSVICFYVGKQYLVHYWVAPFLQKMLNEKENLKYLPGTVYTDEDTYEV